MEEQIKSLVFDYTRRKAGAAPEAVALAATDPWDMRVSFRLPGGGLFEIRNVCEEDAEIFLAVSDGLSAASRESFRPYPWDCPDRLLPALRTAISQAVGRVDACYLMFHDARPVGEFFLWKAGGNPESRAHGLEIPELGIGLVDAYHGRGLGGFCVRFLAIVAGQLKADGIELTTAMDNESGFRTYLSAGYEYAGEIVNPLEADVTAVLSEQASASRWRVEQQMIRVLNQSRGADVLTYLAEKRAFSCALAAKSGFVLGA